MFFFEPSETERNYSIDISIGDQKQNVLFALEREALTEAAERNAVRRRHVEFLKTALACPRCHAPIELDQLLGHTWTCKACGEKYDCSNGLDLIPELFEHKSGIRFQGTISSIGYDGEVLALIQNVAERGGMVLDCGGGWPHAPLPNVITTEILRYPSIDVVAVGEYLPFKDAAFDAVLSLHVLEHVRNPFVCAAELMRVLKPGGKLHAVTPYIAQVHGFPNHFFNPTPSGLSALFEGQIKDTSITVPYASHALIALWELLRVYAHFYRPEFKDKFLDTTIRQFLEKDRNRLPLTEFGTFLSDDIHHYVAGNYLIRGTKI